MSGRGPRGGPKGRAGLLALALPLLAGPPWPDPVPPDGAAVEAAVCAAAPARRIPDPFTIPLVSTPNANGASGMAKLAFASSPFGVAVTEAGHHLYRIRLAASGLPPVRNGVYVAWAVTPSLDELRKLGPLDAQGEVVGRVALNKFLVFVTAEPSAEVERWSGPILLRGISRSGRLHSMAGHGPFSGEPC